MVLDLKTPEGLEAAYRLIAEADVLTHNLRPGKIEKLGLGYDKLAAINPRLIFAYMPGYGSRGPKSLLKSFAPLVSGWTGLLREGGGEGNPPTRSVFGNEDYNNGFLSAAGILMALERRAETGRGDYMEAPQLHSSLWTTSEHFLDADRQVVYGFRLDKDQAGFNALDRIYRTRDGWLCVCCRQDDRFAALAFAIGQPGLPQDPRFADPRARSAHDAELLALLTPFFAARSSADAFAALDAAGALRDRARNKLGARGAVGGLGRGHQPRDRGPGFDVWPCAYLRQLYPPEQNPRPCGGHRAAPWPPHAADSGRDRLYIRPDRRAAGGRQGDAGRADNRAHRRPARFRRLKTTR
jgi:crotonobetainyl-CoA:carnitine CoA-transferase CaiB-like acyl-CoA transferase